jgi:protocatechuate 3,4-dioxygenase beta subunit
MRRLLALVALIILALLAWWQLERARDAPDRAPVRQGEAVPDDVPGRLVRRSSEGAEAEGAEADAPKDPVPKQPPLLLEGRVVHADGSPAQGAEVSTCWGGSAIRSGGQIPEGLERYIWRTTTDEQGCYRFLATRTRPGLPGSLDVRARLDDQVAMPETIDKAEAPYEMYDLVLEAALVVRVRVTNSARAPVAGAHGRLAVFRDGVTEHRRLVAISDGEGLLTFFPLRRSADWSLRLTVTHTSYPEVKTRLDLADQRAGKIGEVVLPFGVQVHGRVADPEGRPLQGVWVVAATRKEDRLKAQWFLQAASGPDGKFVVKGLPAGPSRLLLYAGLERRASSADTTHKLPWLSEPFTGTNGAVIDVGTIVLHKAGTIRGRVVDADGTPLQNATVGLRGPFRGMTNPWAISQADGSFGFKDVPPGEYAVHASQSRGENGVLAGEVPAVRPDAAEIEVQLKINPGIVLRFFSAQQRTKRVATKAISYNCQRTPITGSGRGGVRSGVPVTWYRFDKEPGTWYVRVRVPGYEEVDFGEVTLPADRDLVLDVLLRKSE